MTGETKRRPETSLPGVLAVSCPRMPYFKHDGVELHFIETGQGVPFIFQHGLGGDVRQPFGLFVPPAGFRLISMDCRGHGSTPLGDPNRLGLITFADDLRALMDHLQIPRAVIGGISMGAAISASFALRYPDRVAGLVLSRPAWVVGSQPKHVEIYAQIGEVLLQHGPQGAAEAFQQTPEYQRMLVESPYTAGALLRQLQAPDLEKRMALLTRLQAFRPAIELSDLGAITVPTLVMASRQDPVHPYEYGRLLARTIPEAEFQELTPRAVDKQQHAQDVTRLISEWLRRRFA